MIEDEELKKVVIQFMKDLSRKYPEMRDTNKKLIDELQNKDDIDLYIIHVVDMFKTAVKGQENLFSAVMAAGIKEDMSMREWIIYLYYMMFKALIDKEA